MKTVYLFLLLFASSLILAGQSRREEQLNQPECKTVAAASQSNDVESSEKQDGKKLKRINWAEDPCDLYYVGTPGKIPIKYVDNPKVITLGKSGKKTTGMGGRGLIIDIDSADFFSGKTISNGIVYACGNSSEFPDGLSRSSILILKKIHSRDGKLSFAPDTLLMLLAEQKNLLVDISDNIFLLDRKIDALEKTTRESFSDIKKKLDDLKCADGVEKKSFFSRNWYWIVPTVIGLGIGTYYLCKSRHKTETIVVLDGGGPPPKRPLGKEIGFSFSFGFGR